MADVIDIGAHRPKPNGELVETLRTMLADAQAGRMTSLAAVYLTSQDEIATVYHFDNALEAIGAVSYLEQDLRGLLTE